MTQYYEIYTLPSSSQSMEDQDVKGSVLNICMLNTLKKTLKSGLSVTLIINSQNQPLLASLWPSVLFPSHLAQVGVSVRNSCTERTGSLLEGFIQFT